MKALIILLALAQGAALATERPDVFAYGIPIKAGAQSALYEVEIPLAVYRGVTRSDLGDLRVFNGAGETVPHALKPREALHATAVGKARLPVFLCAARPATRRMAPIFASRSAATAPSCYPESASGRSTGAPAAGLPDRRLR